MPTPAPPRPALTVPDAAALPVPADLDTRLDTLGVRLDAGAIEQIARFLGYLSAMNLQMNLTAVTEPAEMWTRHALDGVSILPALEPLTAGSRVADLGSGGGVPGILLAIARPDLSFTLVESTKKKAAFLEEVSRLLGLGNVEVVADRAESLIPARAASFSVVTARAVARLVELVPWAAPLVKPGGRMVFIKGERAEAELVEAEKVMRRHRCSHRRTVLTPTGRVVVLKVATGGIA